MYKEQLAARGHDPQPLGAHSPGHVAETDGDAREQFWPPFRENRDRIGRERGWAPMTRAEFDREIERGSLYVGSPETVAKKIAATVSILGLSRFDLKYSAGPLRHDLAIQTIALYGREVIPRVRDLLASRTGPGTV